MEAFLVMNPCPVAGPSQQCFGGGALYGRGRHWHEHASADALAAASASSITTVPHDPTLGVDTWWDLGMADASIWFTQDAGREMHIIDYYFAEGKGLLHYGLVLDRKGYPGTSRRSPLSSVSSTARSSHSLIRCRTPRSTTRRATDLISSACGSASTTSRCPRPNSSSTSTAAC